MARPKSDDPPPTKVTVSLPAELVKLVDEHAAAERRSRSNAIEVLLEAGLNAAGRRTAG